MSLRDGTAGSSGAAVQDRLAHANHGALTIASGRRRDKRRQPPGALTWPAAGECQRGVSVSDCDSPLVTV